MALSNSPTTTRVEDFKALTRDGVSNREVPKIKEFAGQIGNYTLEERQELLETTRLALLHRQTQRDAKTALTSFRETMLQYTGMEALDGEDTSRVTVTPEAGNNVSAWNIDNATTHKANRLIEMHEESPLTGNTSLAKIDVTPTQAVALAISIPELGETLNHEKIKKYQKNHNIDDDGVIGKETYGEMLAGIIQQSLVGIDENGIGAGALDAISKLLEYATPEGNNIVLLRARLETFRQEHKDDADFNQRYGDFFGTHTQREEEYIASPEGQAERERVERELSETDADGRSMYRRVSDGIKNGNIGEELESLMEDKGPMVLVLMAGAFIFGMIPGINDTVATNSWWKRLLIAGVAVMNGGSIKDIISDVAGGTRAAYTNLREGGDGSVTDRIRTDRNRIGSALNTAFPESGFLDAVQSHFRDTALLNGIAIADIPQLVEKLGSGNNIPEFLQNIKVNGQVLTNSQIITYLLSLKDAAGTGTPTVSIQDLLTGDGSEYIIGGSIMAAGAIVGLVAGWPIIATLGIIGAGTGALGYFNRDDVQDFIKNNPFLDGLAAKEAAILTEITDPTINDNVRNILKGDSGIAEKVTQLKLLSSQNSTLSSTFNKLIDVVIATDIEYFNIMLQAEANSIRGNLDELRSNIDTKIAYINEHMHDEAEKNRLITLLRESLEAISRTEEIQRRTIIRENVTQNENDIASRVAAIAALENDRTRLLAERSTANAERLSEIEILLSEIPGKINEHETAKAALEITLTGAQRELATLTVEESGIVVDSHLNYLTSILEPAIDTQGIIVAVEVNFNTIKTTKEQIIQINENITLAPESEEKRILNEKTTNILGIIENIGERYKSELGEGASEMTPEALVDRNLDFSNQDTIDSINEAISQVGSDEKQEIYDFFGISTLSLPDTLALYRGEVTRQIEELDNNFSEIEAHQVHQLKAQIDKRNKLLAGYTSLFESEYEDANFQNVLNEKREALLNTPYTTVLFRENLNGESIVNRYLEQLQDPDKTFIHGEFTRQNKLRNVIDLLGHFSNATNEVSYTTEDGSEAIINSVTQQESGELLGNLNEEINFLI